MSATVSEQYKLLLRLLFDADAREQLQSDPDGLLMEVGLSGEGAAPFRAVDPVGLDLDAAQRRQYLMSAMCRAYPLTAGAVGAGPGGAERLAAFLASPAMMGGLAARSQAFGDHLSRLLTLSDTKVDRFMRAFLDFERGLVDTAARVREAVEAGEVAPAPERYAAQRIERGFPTLPPFMTIVQLPCSPAVLEAALDRAGPEDVWRRIASGSLDVNRVRSVARAAPAPVTIAARGYARGQAVTRGGSGGVAPLVDVSHVTVELAGLQAERLAAFDGSRNTRELPDADRGLAEKLLTAGVLQLL